MASYFKDRTQIDGVTKEGTEEQWRTEGGGEFGVFNPPSPKFQRPSKIVPNSTRL